MNTMELNNEKWEEVETYFQKLTGKKPGLNGILFLIGIRETGFGKRKFTKEQKQDLMHIAVCRILASSGYFDFTGTDEEGWPHYKSVKQVPKMSLEEQENLLKAHVIHYFREETLA